MTLTTRLSLLQCCKLASVCILTVSDITAHLIVDIEQGKVVSTRSEEVGTSIVSIHYPVLPHPHRQTIIVIVYSCQLVYTKVYPLYSEGRFTIRHNAYAMQGVKHTRLRRNRLGFYSCISCIHTLHRTVSQALAPTVMSYLKICTYNQCTKRTFGL